MTVARISTDGKFLFQKILRSFLLGLLSFLQAKAVQNSFSVFEELVFFDLWIPDSGFYGCPVRKLWEHE